MNCDSFVFWTINHISDQKVEIYFSAFFFVINYTGSFSLYNRFYDSKLNKLEQKKFSISKSILHDVRIYK